MPNRTAYRSPTADEYRTVKEVFEKTGILTVKDKVTAEWLKPQERCGGVAWAKPWQDRPEYGTEYPPKVVGTNAHETGFSTLTKHIRAVYVEMIGTKMLPKGLAIGGVEVWVTEDVFGSRPPQCVRWQPDISPDEQARLEHWAHDIHHVTQEEYDAAEKESSIRRARGLQSQLDPVGTLAPVMASAMKEAFADLRQPAGPTPEQLAAAGFYKDEATGQWLRREPNALTGAAKK